MSERDKVLLILLVIMNIPVYMYAFRVTFGNIVQELDDAMRVMYDPFLSLFLRILRLCFVAVFFGSVLGEYYLLVRFVLNRPPFWA